jgi:hypothetical protein
MSMPWQTPGFSSNPYAAYHQFRASPASFNEHGWVLTRHTDIVAVLKDAHFGFGEPAGGPGPAAPGEAGGKLRHVLGQAEHLKNLWLGATNPPEHTRLRAALAPPLSPGSVARLRPRIQVLTDGLIDRVEGAGQMDIIADLADPLPVMVIAEMLGLPLAHVPRMKAWSAEIMRMLDVQPRPIDSQRGLLAMAAFAEYLRPVIARRQREPQADVISQLLAGPTESQVSPDELVANCIAFFFAGQETTVATIGNGLLALLLNPDQLQRLLAEPALIGTAVEELLRYDSPAQITWRGTLGDVVLDGHAYRKNQRVILLLGAGNRDPERFAEPDRLLLDRAPNPHLGFGQGLHYCLGAHLARAETQIVLSTLLRRLPRLALQDRPLDWMSSLRVRGLKALPVRF